MDELSTFRLSIFHYLTDAAECKCRKFSEMVYLIENAFSLMGQKFAFNEQIKCAEARQGTMVWNAEAKRNDTLIKSDHLNC